jgi:hypothetical protein
MLAECDALHELGLVHVGLEEFGDGGWCHLTVLV